MVQFQAKMTKFQAKIVIFQAKMTRFQAILESLESKDCAMAFFSREIALQK